MVTNERARWNSDFSNQKGGSRENFFSFVFFADWTHLRFRIPSSIDSSLIYIKQFVFFISIFLFKVLLVMTTLGLFWKMTSFTNEAFGELHLNDHKLSHDGRLEFPCLTPSKWNVLFFSGLSASTATYIELNSVAVWSQHLWGFELLLLSLSLSFVLIQWKWFEMGFGLLLIIWMMHACLFKQRHLNFKVNMESFNGYLIMWRILMFWYAVSGKWCWHGPVSLEAFLSWVQLSDLI